jgi:hypothetical protein
VDTNIAEHDIPLDRLKEDYKGAFEEWAAQVNHLQTVSESAPEGGLVVKEAECKVEAAHRSYQDSRDRLAEEIG